MNITVETITPIMAIDLLMTNTNNRTIRKARVTQYAEMMSNGKWLVTGEPLIFNDKGDLINGQHRLRACIQADKAFTTAVARGAPPEAYEVIDVGLGRSASDLAAQMGFTGSSNVASAAKVVLAFRAGTIGNATATQITANRQRIVTELEKNADMYRSMSANRWAALQAGVNISGLGAFMVLVDECHGIEIAQEFISGILSGANLDVGDPRLAVLRLMVGPARPKTAAPTLAVLIRAYTSWLAGERRSIIKGWVPGTAFPTFPKLAGQAPPLREGAAAQSRRLLAERETEVK